MASERPPIASEPRPYVLGRFTFLEFLTLLTLPSCYLLGVAAIIWGNLSSDLIGAVVGALVVGAAGVILGYWYGTSAGSQRKDDVAAQRNNPIGPQ